jgi:hypothetical protein
MAVDRLYKTYTIERKTAGDGRTPGAYAAAGSSRGYLQQQSNAEAIVNGALKIVQSFLLMTTVSADLRSEDRITYDGVAYVVASGGGPNGIVSLGSHKEYVLVRADDGS